MPIIPRIVRKGLKYGAAGTVAGGVAISLPPLDSVPESLFTVRIVIDAMCRAARAVKVGSSVGLDYYMSVTEENTQAEWNAVHKRNAEKLVYDLAEPNNGMWLKWSQGLASMGHMVPPEYVEACSKTQDDVCRRPFSEIKTVIERDYGRPLEDIFEEFDEVPMAAASVAQVHRAKLRRPDYDQHATDSGKGRLDGTTPSTDVAVKVQYIDIQTRYNGDRELINCFLRIAGVFFKGYDWGELVKKTKEVAKREQDFRFEAENTKKCREQMYEQFGGNVTTPYVVDHLTQERVLVTEFIQDSVKATDKKGMVKKGLKPSAVGTLMASAFGHQLFVTGHVHADPHPSNVFIRQHPSNHRKPQVVILDHGLYQDCDAENVKIAADIWVASCTHNDAMLKECCRKLGLPEDRYEILASSFIMQNYHAFSTFKTKNSTSDVGEMKSFVQTRMNESTEVVEALPDCFPLWLRGLLTYRATHVLLNPGVSRYSILLRAALKTSSLGQNMTTVGLWWALLQVHWQEFVNKWMMAYAKWKYPEVMDAVGMFAVG